MFEASNYFTWKMCNPFKFFHCSISSVCLWPCNKLVPFGDDGTTDFIKEPVNTRFADIEAITDISHADLISNVPQSDAQRFRCINCY
jgi:hypothetical protein